MSGRSVVGGFLSAVVLGVILSASSAPFPAPSPNEVSSDKREGRRLALLIGIGDYKHFDRRGPAGQTDLVAPPRDVERMRLTLRRFGFDGEENVRILVDAEASKEGIADGFRWLTDRATNSADVVVIYYSGHGTYTGDLDGDEALVTKGDEHDEALVPWDASRGDDPAPLVLDDELRHWLDALGTENVTLIVDACYSGTVSRGAPMEEAEVTATPRGPIGNSGSGAALNPLTQPSHALLTAAGSGEQAWEMRLGDDQEPFGIFTYHLTRALDGAGSHARYDELMYDLRRRVRMDADRAQPWDVLQTPQLEGDGSARLFRVGGDIAKRPFVLVEGAGGGDYSIDAGAVHGVRVGAIYDVFPPEEIEFGGPPLGHLRVDSVSETRSFGSAFDESGAPPDPAGGFLERSRAALARVPVGATTLERLAVHVEPGAEEAARAIKSLAFIELADAASADARIRTAGDVTQVVVNHVALPPLNEDDPGARQGNHDGEKIVVFAPIAEALCPPLRRAFAIASFERIQNPAPPIEFDLRLQLVEEGQPPPSAPPDAQLPRTDTAFVGRNYDLYAWVGPTEGYDLGGTQFYLSVALEGYVSDPWVMYPHGRDRGMPQPVELGRWIPVAAGRDGIRMAPPAGPEVIKAVANSDQYDFRSLADRVSGLCRSATERGAGEREEDAEQASPVLGWKTLDHAVLILPEPTDS